MKREIVNKTFFFKFYDTLLQLTHRCNFSMSWVPLYIAINSRIFCVWLLIRLARRYFF